MSWDFKTLDELGKVARGKSKHRPRNDKRLFGGIYPFIQTADVKKANFYIYEYSETYNEIGLAQSKLWDAGTLCITIAANIADTAILSMPACFPDSIMGFIPYDGISDVRFIKYCFDILQRKCKQISQGTAQDNLSWEKLSTIKFPAPPLKIQCRIAEVLSRYDSLIENYQKQIKLLEEAAQRLYKEWFVNLRFPGYEKTKIVDGLPEGWKKVFLTELIEPQYGKDHKSLSDGLIPLYGSGGIMRYVNKVLYSGESVLIPRKGSLNNIMLVSGSFWTIDTMFYSKPLLNYIMKLVYFYLKGKDLYVYNVGAAVPSMTVNILSKMDIILPDENIRKCFDDKLSLIFNNITNLASQIRILTEARDSLLPKLMRGEIEV